MTAPLSPARLAEIEALLRIGDVTIAQRDALHAAIGDLLAELRRREAVMRRLANALPDDVRAVCLDAECKETIGSLVGRAWDAPKLPEPPDASA